MRRFEYKSKNDHVEINLDFYSPQEVVNMARTKIKEWKKEPKKKLISFKIERK